MNDLKIAADGSLTLDPPSWPGFRLAALRPEIQVGGARPALQAAGASEGRAEWAGGGCRVSLDLVTLGEDGVEVKVRLAAGAAGVLNHADLLAGETVSFGSDPARVRVMMLSRYGGDAVPLVRPVTRRAAGAGEPNETAAAPEPSTLAAEDVMVVYDRAARQAPLIGFMSSERWQGRITLRVAPDGTAQRLTIGFDGGDLRLEAGDELALESFVLLRGSAPWALLERYGNLVRARHGVACPEAPPVSWCSWYPYRLGVTEDRMLAEARIAAERLKPLGLSTIKADLGWERQHLPNAFEPNEKFPHGLKWLARQMKRLGLGLGVWKAPFTISAFDELPVAHPEWLIRDEAGKPLSVWTWFWEPHGDVYVLDPTHPGAQQWLRERFGELRDAGIAYFKADFIGMVADGRAKRRHDTRVVSGGGTEAARIGARIIREALPQSLILNCGGPPVPGTGAWPLLYICNDTGNTGLLSWEFMRNNYRAVACHLWQNHRWGIIQPSCLCVGLPGSLEEARLRATVAFLAGGQIDISDTLTTLPEDRWAVLEATLPPLGLTARPVDLFEPVHHRKVADYEALCKGLPTAIEEREHAPGSVWHLHVERGWDAWDLVGCFAFDQGAASERPELTNFTIPLERLGLDPAATYWAYEFWSGQFLGAAPGSRTNPERYAHPGDWQDSLMPAPSGFLSLSYNGPGAKLLALRRMRSHPWVVGTTFHQSCGAELADVTWDAEAGVLSGRVDRPAGQCGQIIVAGVGRTAKRAEANGRSAPLMPSAGGSWRLTVVTGKGGARWSVRFGKPTHGVSDG